MTNDNLLGQAAMHLQPGIEEAFCFSLSQIPLS